MPKVAVRRVAHAVQRFQIGIDRFAKFRDTEKIAYGKFVQLRFLFLHTGGDPVFDFQRQELQICIRERRADACFRGSGFFRRHLFCHNVIIRFTAFIIRVVLFPDRVELIQTVRIQADLPFRRFSGSGQEFLRAVRMIQCVRLPGSDRDPVRCPAVDPGDGESGGAGQFHMYGQGICFRIRCSGALPF